MSEEKKKTYKEVRSVAGGETKTIRVLWEGDTKKFFEDEVGLKGKKDE